MDIFAIAFSFLVVLWQIPDKSMLYEHLLLIDIATFVGLAYVVVTIGSPSLTLIMAKASIVITIMLHLSRWAWKLRH